MTGSAFSNTGVVLLFSSSTVLVAAIVHRFPLHPNSRSTRTATRTGYDFPIHHSTANKVKTDGGAKPHHGRAEGRPSGARAASASMFGVFTALP